MTDELHIRLQAKPGSQGRQIRGFDQPFMIADGSACGLKATTIPFKLRQAARLAKIRPGKPQHVIIAPWNEATIIRAQREKRGNGIAVLWLDSNCDKPA